ncbi:type II secretion system protein L [Serratia marcescens]|nr:type II secretion system protein L [Serratia marcescens]
MKKPSKKPSGQTIMRIPGTPDAPWRWRYQPAQGEAQEGCLCADAPAHNLPDADADLSLLLPAGRVLFRQVAFTGRLRRRTPQALLWQLEDFTLGDVEQLHVTVLQRDSDNCHLAAVETALLQQWLARLNAWGLRPCRALPDALALPPNSAIKLDDEWLVHSGEQGGFTAAGDELPLLQLYPDLLCHSLRPPGLDTWRQGPLQAPLALLAQGAALSRCNLLHAQFAVRRDGRFDKLHRLPLALAACYLLSFAAEPLWSGLQAQRQAAQLQQQAGLLYQHHFPAAPPPTQPRRQWAQRIAEEEAALQHPGLLPLLAQSRPLLNALPAGATQALSWDGERLTLSLNTPEQPLQPLLARYPSESLRAVTEPGTGQTSRLILTRNEP